jgi:hypothetical protein
MAASKLLSWFWAPVGFEEAGCGVAGLPRELDVRMGSGVFTFGRGPCGLDMRFSAVLVSTIFFFSAIHPFQFGTEND